MNSAIRALCRLRIGIVPAILLATPLVAPTRAQSDNTKNAATWYERAFEDLERFTPEEMEKIEEYRGNPGAAPSPEVRNLLNRAAPIIDNLMRASAQGYSDFGLDYSAGFDLLLPHLGKMRSIARLVQADSAMRLADGDGNGAAARIAALYRLADHSGDDHILISSLVSRAIFEVADTSAQSGFDRGAFDPAAAAVLLRSTSAFDQADPFQGLEALMMEQTLCVNMIREHFAAEDPERRSEILGLLTSEAGMDERFANLSPEDLDQSLNQYTALMDRYVVAFTQEDPETARAMLADIEKGFETGEYGLIAQLLTPALGRAYESMLSGRDKLHARIELLEGITRGEVDPMTLTNAAVWYRRGIQRMEALDDSWRKALAGFDSDQSLSEEQLESLQAGADAARAAIDIFLEGSNIRRCDFSPERGADEVFIPKYAPGMRDAFRLLALESLRTAIEGDTSAAAELLAGGFRIAAHLSDDHLLVSALVARDGFLLLSATAAAVETKHHFNEPARQQLAAGIRRCGTSDPFGFVGACMKAREALGKDLKRWGSSDEAESRAAGISRWLNELDADGLIYLLAMLDVNDYNLKPREPSNRAGAARLSEFLLAETMDLASIDAPAFAQIVRDGRVVDFVMPETIRLVGAAERMASARRDQWQTINWARQRADAGGAETSGAAPSKP